MQQVVSDLLSLIPHTLAGWEVILGSGATVSVVLQLVKHFGGLQEAKKFVTTLLGLLSLAAGLLDASAPLLLQHANLLPAAIVGWILAAAVFIHRFMVSPAYNGLMNFKNGIYADAMELRQQRAAALQATSTTTSTTTANPASLAAASTANTQEFTLPL